MTILNNALSGALAAQVALAATSQNIANMQTKGYTRQSALLTAVGPDGSSRSAGNGVQASALLRFSDGYKSQQLWRAASSQGQYSQTQPYLAQLEGVMGDNSSSLSGGIDKFFNSLIAAAGGDPSSTAMRQQVLSTADQMAQRFNSMNSLFASQRQSVNQQRSAIVDSANTTIANIGALNLQIVSGLATGQNVSTLLDARGQAIDDLAGQMALDVSDQPDGSVNLSLKSGQLLVTGRTYGKLSVSTDNGNQVFRLDTATSSFGLDATALGGQLGGLSSYVKDSLTPLQQGVADLAKSLSDNVNSVLTSVKMQDGSDGKPLFNSTPDSGNLLQVSDAFQAGDLAFSSDGTAGDNGNLQKLVALQNLSIPVTGLGNVVMGDADIELVGKLGADSQRNQSSLATANAVRTQAGTDWLSTSGVNQDEEAANLVQYQQMYQANMKVMSVANALFDATLQMMG